jgi:hypothetical protein
MAVEARRCQGSVVDDENGAYQSGGILTTSATGLAGR